MADLSTGKIVSAGVLRAATQRLSVCLAGLTATTAVVLQSWSLFLAAMAGYTTLVAWDLSRATFWRQTVAELRRRPPELPECTEFVDGLARRFLLRLMHARAEFRRVFETCAARLPEPVVARLEHMVDWEERALHLVQRLEDVSRYVGEKNPNMLRNEAERLRQIHETAPDARLRQEYGKARRALEEELGTIRDILMSKELLVARLETITSTLELLPSQLVRLHLTEAESRDSGVEELDPRNLLGDARMMRELLGEHGDLRALDRVPPS